MNDLDSALNELGMLSNMTSYKMEYIQEMEKASEMRKVRDRQEHSSSGIPVTKDTAPLLDPHNKPDPFSIKVNSAFVTSINIRTSVDSDSRSRRLSDQEGVTAFSCPRRHSCPTGHICSFVSPPRSRIITVPGSSSLPYRLRPCLPPLGGALSRTRGRGSKFRGRVRFRECNEAESPLYQLDEELTSKLANIKLTMGEGGGNTAGGQWVGQQLCKEVNRLEIADDRH